MDPMPPMIGSRLSMVLDPVQRDLDPTVRRTAMVTSVVGLLEARLPPEAPTSASVAVSPEPTASSVELIGAAAAHVPPRAAASAISSRTGVGFFSGERKFFKTSGLFALVMGTATALGRPRR